jgi:hypothetical protein
MGMKNLHTEAIALVNALKKMTESDRAQSLVERAEFRAWRRKQKMRFPSFRWISQDEVGVKTKNIRPSRGSKPMGGLLG